MSADSENRVKHGCRQSILTKRELAMLTKRLRRVDDVIERLRRLRRIDWRGMHEPMDPWIGARR